MAFTETEESQLRQRLRPWRTGYYHVRRRRSVISAEILNDPDLISSYLDGIDIEDGVVARVYKPLFCGAIKDAPGLGYLLDAAIGWNPSNRHGVIQSASDLKGRALIPTVTSPECAALLNVKSWTFSGSIGSFSFAAEVGAGEFADYFDGSRIESPWDEPLQKRAALVTNFRWQEGGSGGDPGCHVRICIGGFDDEFGPAGVNSIVMNEEPSYLRILPRIGFFIRESNHEADHIGLYLPPNQDDPGEEIPAATFLGRPMRMRVPEGFDTPEGVSLTIGVGSYWTNEDPWYGGPE